MCDNTYPEVNVDVKWVIVVTNNHYLTKHSHTQTFGPVLGQNLLFSFSHYRLLCRMPIYMVNLKISPKIYTRYLSAFFNLLHPTKIVNPQAAQSQALPHVKN